MRHDRARPELPALGAAVMAMNRVQFQSGLSLAGLLRRYGTESVCTKALEAAFVIDVPTSYAVITLVAGFAKQR